ncbi:EAL domain-containing protein [Legionella israelensis]|uniref:EAL domain-containing protein n=1 Tax=Legionella israelensis TaxID=454 RepID=UPI00117C4254|nr:EAL domain-containing protein [Legionella israelensis]QDP71868.1 EAL domain-containing protein [Legionella israelensis]
MKKKKNKATFNHLKCEKVTDLNHPLIQGINKCHEAAIVFNENGKIIAISNEAARLFSSSPKPLVEQSLWSQLNLDSFAKKRLFVRARCYFRSVKEGLPQQFTWVEKKEDKPVLALNIVLSQTSFNDELVYIAQLQDILQLKLTEWVLWSLAKISNYEKITEIIDEILLLANRVFDADHAMVSLVENKKIARSVSYYHEGKKTGNISYSLENTPCEIARKKQKICHYPGHVQEKFPKDHLLQELKAESYIGGPITNAQNKVVGLLTLIAEKAIPVSDLNDTLFRLFLDRIGLEIEKLLYQKELQFLASIPKQDPNPVMRMHTDGEVIFANHKGKEILNHWQAGNSSPPAKILNSIMKARDTGQIITEEITVQNKTYLLTLVWISDFNQINLYGTDITNLKNAQQNILNLARYDALTQIANRQYFEEKLLIHIANHEKLALLLIDIDNFKIINDTLGHPVGDRLLKIATKRMQRCLRENDFIARLGGDEFIIMLCNNPNESVTIVAEKINDVLAKPFQFGDYSLDVTCSIGISFFPDSATNASNLLKQADIAMYQAKRSGKNQYAVFSNQLHGLTQRRQKYLKKELITAAAKNELFVTYQPYFNMQTAEVSGFEAFLRWLHPKEGLIFPIEFIPIAEQNGTIHTIGQWSVEQAISEYASTLMSKDKIKLSLNISLTQISDARFMDTLLSSIEQYGISADHIVLDISEHIMATGAEDISKLNTFNRHGIKLSLDNFGSLEVSLTRLAALPIHYLKLDKKLLDDIEHQQKSRSLLSGIIELAKKLNIAVIQKGVEEKEQHELLKSLGCPYAQGNYYCPPLRLKELQDFIREHETTMQSESF